MKRVVRAPKTIFEEFNLKKFLKENKFSYMVELVPYTGDINCLIPLCSQTQWFDEQYEAMKM